MKNPFLEQYNTPFQTPPFDKIKEEDYLPAIEKGIEEEKAYIQNIIDNTEEPTFENVVAALEYGGETLEKAFYVFMNLLHSCANDNMEKIAQKAVPMVMAFSDEISLNPDLFKKIKYIYDQKDQLNLDPDQLKLLKDTYKSYIRKGASLNQEEKEELKNINQELSKLKLNFSNNSRKASNDWKLIIDKAEDLSGLPDNIIANAKGLAISNGMEDKWVFILDASSMIPFLQFADNRELRKEIHTQYISRCNQGGELDNNENIKKIIQYRIRKAEILGYDSYAHYILDDKMAHNPQNAYTLMYDVWEKALPAAIKESRELQDIIDELGHNITLEHYDWWYYTEKLKKQKFELNEDMLRPYFKLENVRDGAFSVANKLYGIKFKQRNDIPKYHEDVVIFEVLDKDDKHIGVFYTDYYKRESKQSGAWMNTFRVQSSEHTPLASNVCNFQKPTDDTPSLLTLEEVRTLFHEFGHALHGLLSKVRYQSQSGTAIPTDFVELPSQIMENWALEPEVLRMYAKHYQTKEAIPGDLIMKIQDSSHFNQGFETVEYLSAAILDMDYHILGSIDEQFDPSTFEEAILKKINMIPEIVVRYRSNYFNHIFSLGYEAGYYSYNWSAVLDADAFAAFKETGDIFNPKVAAAFKDNVLSKGGTEEADVLYRKFRGKDPDVDALMKRKGF
ncbi:MAG: M3 family metallopeptidase [Hyphomicrobiales bacterium]